MKLKKVNALLALLAILCMLLHIGYSVFAYLTMYYDPLLKYVFAVPFMVLTCLHAVCGMITVFTQADGTRMDLYPKQNVRTVLQRVSAALIFPLLILHINTFSLLQSSAQNGQVLFILLLLAAEILFFAVVITHVAVSLTRAFITLGLLSSRDTQARLDRVIYILGAIAFALSLYAVLRGQIAMFL